MPTLIFQMTRRRLGSYGEAAMSKLGIVGATALSLALAVATPALALRGGAMHVGGGGGAMHASP